MRHWLRNLPELDEAFVSEHIAPLEEMYGEREAIDLRISKAELDVHQAVFKRWTPEQIDASFNTPLN